MQFATGTVYDCPLSKLIGTLKMPITKETLLSLVSPKMSDVIEEAFPHLSSDNRVQALCEFVKFAHLAAHIKNLFFPCTKQIDDIWHCFVLETREYQKFCHSIAPGSFIHHSGITFRDYSEQRVPNEAVELQLSALASYVENFGEFTEEAIPYWPVASHLVATKCKSVAGLNHMLQTLGAHASENQK